MTQLVGEHRENQVVLEQAHQVVGDHDRAAGEREGVGAEQPSVAKVDLRDRIDAGPPRERLRRSLDARSPGFGEAGGREHDRFELAKRLPADECLRPVRNQHHRPIRDRRNRGSQRQDREREYPDQSRRPDRREPFQPVRPPGHLRLRCSQKRRGKLLEGREALAGAQREGLRDAGESLARLANLDVDSGGAAGGNQVEPPLLASEGCIDPLGGPRLVEVAPYPQIAIPTSWISPNSSPNA